MLKQRLLSWSRRRKRLVQVVTDILLIWLSLALAFIVRIGWDDTWEVWEQFIWLYMIAPLISIPIYIRMGMYRAVIRYAGKELLVTIARAVTVSALFLALVIYWYRDAPMEAPRSLVINYWWISLLILGGLRLLMRYYFLGDWWAFLNASFNSHFHDKAPKVAIYGAGSAGNQLAAALKMGRAMRPVAFIDDDPHIVKRTIAGIRVYSPRDLEKMLKETGATQILLAMPSASRARRREILNQLERYSLKVLSIPGFMDLAKGTVKVQDLQEVDIADLLGRDCVKPDQKLFERCIYQKVVLVTGAGGSIGSELCRQIVDSGAVKLILFDHSEYNLYRVMIELEQRVKREALQIEIIPVLGSVTNFEQIFRVMQAWQVETVYHAAAYKHVPIVEMNTVVGLYNNLFGTLYTAQAAIKAQVENFVLISTDKAVRPTNVMGATKRLAEMTLQALSHEPYLTFFTGVGAEEGEAGREYENQTRFTMVRFGNVLGSSGSVIPLFREQIKRGGPVTVTHPNITRYFMTIPEAAQLVIQAGSMGVGGDVFVLDMGKPVRIAELAEKMISLTGLSIRSEKNPTGDIAIEFTGLRPGEKLYEELLIGDNVSETIHPMIMRANETMLLWSSFKELLAQLYKAMEQEDCVEIRKLLREYVDGYAPQGQIVDKLYLQEKGSGDYNSLE